MEKIYKNGNYIVNLDTEIGSKSFRTFKAWENYNPEFPDSLDVKLTNKCSRGCPFCMEKSTNTGQHADLDKLWNILSQLPNKPIEIALGGGDIFELMMDPLTSIKLGEFLGKLKLKGFQIGMTFELDLYLNYIKQCSIYFNSYPKLIDSIGLSITSSQDLFNNNIVGTLKTIYGYGDPNLNGVFPKQAIIFHAIVGLIDVDILNNLMLMYDEFSKEDIVSLSGSRKYSPGKVIRLPRIIFLGYKDWGRGISYRGQENDRIEENTKKLRKFINHNFLRDINVDREARRKYDQWNISFDNLAIEQLGIKSQLTTSMWNTFFMGEEMSHSMYVDGVSQTFAPSSHSNEISKWEYYNNNILDYFNLNKLPHDKS